MRTRGRHIGSAGEGRGRRPGRRLVVALSVLAVTLTGCDQASDLADRLPDDLRSEAQRRAQEQVDGVRDRVGDQVAERVEAAVEEFGGAVDVERVCDLVADGRLTATERGRLQVAMELTDALGLPDAVVGPATTMLNATNGATDRVEGLVEGCSSVGANLQEGN